MTTRDQFIGTISSALGRSKLPTSPGTLALRHSVHRDVMKDYGPDELLRTFVENSRSTGTEVLETTHDKLIDTIRLAMEQCKPGAIVAADDPWLRENCTAIASQTKRSVRLWNTEDSSEDNIRCAQRAAVGIAFARLALAESGTVLFFSQEGCGRSVTLLPESNVYVIPKSAIRPRLTQGMAFVREHKDCLPASVNFVSGPSATSDIELVRVVGVHGPIQVIHVIVHDT
jgi:L-lactate dehydrogenase complex protein LldG